MFILAMRCIQLRKQSAVTSPTTTCRRIWRFTLGNGLHKGGKIWQQNTRKATG